MVTHTSAPAQSDSHGRWLFKTPASFLFGCAWIAGAFAVLIFTFVQQSIGKPDSPVEEMGITNATLAAHHASEPPSAR
jgi:hypothetical protein